MKTNNCVKIIIIFQGKKFTGNNQEILIEQLENQGFRIPYYCRVGICGECQLQLISGKIIPPPINKFFLSCSSIPSSNIEIS
ncbi:MAG: 2Fe-2S iron-sulfur cluster binding domain-containing protein [Candidatus Dasytiphilus stammeri]